jgi:hypothetical protein
VLAGAELLDELVATDEVRTGLTGLRGLLAAGDDRDHDVFPMPWGSETAPRTIWSAWRVSTPETHDRVDGRVVGGAADLLQERRTPQGV